MEMNRRGFIAGVSAFAAVPSAVSGEKRVFKIALVGCGTRGEGAVDDFTAAAKLLGCGTRLVAAADFFVEKAAAVLKRNGGDESHAFGGANGYKEVMKSDAEIVLLCTPPLFRPRHVQAAVNAGKHVFAEKPVATDPRGLRLFLKAAKDAEAKGIALLAGTQMRHSNIHLAQLDAVRSGAIGDIVAAQCIRYQNAPWVRPRELGQSNAAYMCNNWLHFREMGGDFMTEQVIHEIDVGNWFIGRLPVSAIGTCARRCRPAGIGNICDSFTVDYDYGNDLHMLTMCRHLTGKPFAKGTILTGTEGRCWARERIERYDGRKVDVNLAKYDRGTDHFQQLTHYDGLKAFMDGRIVNDGECVAMANATTMIGTYAAYTGDKVTIDDLLKNESSAFYNGWNNVVTPEMFEETEDVPLPKEGVAPIPEVSV